MTPVQQAARDRAVEALDHFVTRILVHKLGVTVTTTDRQEIAQIVDDLIDAATPAPITVDVSGAWMKRTEG